MIAFFISVPQGRISFTDHAIAHSEAATLIDGYACAAMRTKKKSFKNAGLQISTNAAAGIKSGELSVHGAGAQ